MISKLRLLCSVLALVAFVHPAVAQPVLSVTRSTNHSILSWPAVNTGYVLQFTTNLSKPNWVVTNIAQVTVNNNITVTFTNTKVSTYFRLMNTNTSVIPAGMVLIPAGSFTIGDTLDGESDATPATVTVSAYYMDTNLASLDQWTAVYTYAISHSYGFANGGAGKAGNYPVETVDWFDCVKWCNARSQQAGLTPVYYTDAALTQIYTHDTVYPETNVVYVKWGTNGYRLPTEAEWEKAARGGVSGQRFPWGNTISWSQANYWGRPGTYSYDQSTANTYDPTYTTGIYPYMSPVGSFPANGYGLRDMAGNAAEWCWDWYNYDLSSPGSPYAGGTDPHGAAASSYAAPEAARVLRGGDWGDFAPFAKCAARNSDTSTLDNDTIGFRCVKTP